MAEEEVKSGSGTITKRNPLTFSWILKTNVHTKIQYQHNRKEMAKIHPGFFGLPGETDPFKPVSEMTADEKAAYEKQRKLIRTGYTRIQQEVLDEPNFGRERAILVKNLDP